MLEEDAPEEASEVRGRADSEDRAPADSVQDQGDSVQDQGDLVHAPAGSATDHHPRREDSDGAGVGDVRVATGEAPTITVPGVWAAFCLYSER